MRPRTEREAIRAFLNAYAEMAPVERRCRRSEAIVIVANVLVVIVNVTLPALGGFGIVDFVNYAAAAVCALILRAVVLAGMERRRNWEIMELGRLHALARLDYLDHDSRNRTPDRTPA